MGGTESREYSGRILRVDLDHRSSEVTTVDNSVMRKYIGGAGQGARILWDETSSTTDPLSPENRLLFMIGPLTGIVPWSSHASVCALSPLTNGWGEAAVGGTWAAEFSKTGLLGIVISGRAPEPVYLFIRDNEVHIVDASHLWGKDTFDTHDLLRMETDNKASVAAIGRAGERLVRIAGIVADGSSSRIAARCGLGAVMGSKNLKAVVVRGTKKSEVFDQAGLQATNRETRQRTDKFNAGTLRPRSQPPDSIDRNNRMGNLGVRNQSRGTWDAFAKKFREFFEPGKHYYCSRCPTSCVESHVNERTRMQGLEMLMPVGANCLIDDFAALQEAYELCNRYGIDTISFGYTLSFAMEIYEKGIITQGDTGGIDFTWGNHEAMLRLVKEIGENEGFGKILGLGSKRAAEQIGGDSMQYAMQVKGLEITHWDPRLYSALMLGYATGNKGGSHLESPGHSVSNARPEEGHGLDLADYGYSQRVNPLGFDGKAAIVKKVQEMICLINSLVICHFSYTIYGVRTAQYLSWLNSITGLNLDTEAFARAGERIFNLKRLINLRRGMSGKDDTLPARLFTKMPDVGDEQQQVPSSLADLLQEYYALRGWDKDGTPTEQKLRELQLS
jgi:aldehyde:ferredoxin oxidoreductase